MLSFDLITRVDSDSELAYKLAQSKKHAYEDFCRNYDIFNDSMHDELHAIYNDYTCAVNDSNLKCRYADALTTVYLKQQMHSLLTTLHDTISRFDNMPIRYKRFKNAITAIAKQQLPDCICICVNSSTGYLDIDYRNHSVVADITISVDGDYCYNTETVSNSIQQYANSLEFDSAKIFKLCQTYSIAQAAIDKAHAEFINYQRGKNAPYTAIGLPLSTYDM